MLARNARVDPASDTDHVPLNLACEKGSTEIVELLLKHGAVILPDAEGLYPQHLVARSGNTPGLFVLLRDYGADLDQIDKLYSWTPLFHAANEGHVSCLQSLIELGVKIKIMDEKQLSALYYATWEGHLRCMRLLTSMQVTGGTPKTSARLGSIVSSPTVPMALDSDGIPALELPPPIIPLRRYGHSFLDTKTFIQISFGEEGDQSVLFFDDSKYPASRLTISSKHSELIPKNILLPFQEDTRVVSFQVDTLDSFAIDFEVYPTYGAKIIAKTIALPNTFRALNSSSGSCILPLFDPRLRSIGQISFKYQVIKPFQGKPLEITDFETYWKATSQFDHRPSAFITGSSLSGEYVQLHVQHTRDGVPVLWPWWTINWKGLEIPVSRLSCDEFRAAGSFHKPGADLHSTSEIVDVHRYYAGAAVTLRDALRQLPRGMHVNLHVLFPSREEEKSLHLGPTININSFCDAILSVVFEHTRLLHSEAPQDIRSFMFSSYNPVICTGFNWKQPNYPTFLCNDLGRDEQMLNPTVLQISGRRTASIKEAVRIAQDNNFMGLVCSSQLLVR